MALNDSNYLLLYSISFIDRDGSRLGPWGRFLLISLWLTEFSEEKG